MGKWLVAVEWDVLVCVGGLAVDVKVEGAVGIADDCDVKHGYATVLLDFFGPFDVRVDGVEIVVQGFDVIVVYGN